jgi:hypothetical protein
LLCVKTRLEHGLFSRWVRDELRCTVRTAENYMSAASLASESKREMISSLPPTSVYKLAAPSMPADAKSRILGALAANEVSIGAIEAEVRLVRQQMKQIKKTTIPSFTEKDGLDQVSIINEIASLLQAALSHDVYRRICTLMTCPAIVENPSTLPLILLEVFDVK